MTGKWYLASYGFDEVIGQCWAEVPDGKILRFRCGSPFRTKQFVESHAILGEVPDPRWFAWLYRLFGR